MRTTLLRGVAIALFAAGVAHAQPVDVPALQKVIETQPAGEDRSAWKEKGSRATTAARTIPATQRRRTRMTLIMS